MNEIELYMATAPPTVYQVPGGSFPLCGSLMILQEYMMRLSMQTPRVTRAHANSIH
jgi:hypothetical protein